jgi:NADH:ubiquinone oxidoreductase subunit 6 (subunit J)
MNLMMLAGVMVTATLIVAVHMTARVFHAPGGNVLWRIARYIGGCVAILAGLLFVLDWPEWLTVAGIIVVAGAATVVSYLVVELYNYHGRAMAAEDDHDSTA